MTGSGDAKRLVIHFQTMEARDACVGAAHQQFPDLVFHAHDPKQLRSDEDLRAIQVTDIPFFLTKDNIMSYFKNLVTLRPVEFTPGEMPKYNKPELFTILPTLLPVLTPNGLFIASPPASG
ncbi:hypothetical protein RclHR1_28250003 [Rhizophagus clarus]|uniref:Uncharacterized protein n=1 Tax=Rhizophagus clarus TaxID=94130 RepID=A0A2Z6RXG8_9GLOM|nr:hypothetical protein RclHR1_28250003 [Rhizophagus clarus]